MSSNWISILILRIARQDSCRHTCGSGRWLGKGVFYLQCYVLSCCRQLNKVKVMDKLVVHMTKSNI
jgi:hypothetical protein